MIAEMFDMVGFHLPPKLPRVQQKNLQKMYNLSGPICPDSRLYTREKDDHQLAKEKMFTEEDISRVQYLDQLPIVENLTGRLVQILNNGSQNKSLPKFRIAFI